MHSISGFWCKDDNTTLIIPAVGASGDLLTILEAVYTAGELAAEFEESIRPRVIEAAGVTAVAVKDIMELGRGAAVLSREDANGVERDLVLGV